MAELLQKLVSFLQVFCQLLEPPVELFELFESLVLHLPVVVHVLVAFVKHLTQLHRHRIVLVPRGESCQARLRERLVHFVHIYVLSRGYSSSPPSDCRTLL